MAPLAFRGYVSVDLLDLFWELNVIPIVLPGNSEFDGVVMGGCFPAFVQAWISFGPGMIATPLLILPFIFLFSYIPWWKIICSRMVVVFRSKFPCFLKEISIYAFCDHHVDNFLQLVVVWDTLYILVEYSACIRAVIAGTICSARFLSMRARIVFFCCQFTWWRVMVLGRKTPIIFLFHSDRFLNWEWLVPYCRSEYVRAILEMTSTRSVPIQWSSVGDDDHCWNRWQVLT